MKLPCVVYKGSPNNGPQLRVVVVRDEEDHRPRVVVERWSTDHLGAERWTDAEAVYIDIALKAAVIALALTVEEQDGGSGEIEDA